MADGVHDERYRALIRQLRCERVGQGLSQTALAARLGQRQQFVSKYETGERRLDIVEFLAISTELSIDVVNLLVSNGLLLERRLVGEIDAT